MLLDSHWLSPKLDSTHTTSLPKKCLVQGESSHIKPTRCHLKRILSLLSCFEKLGNSLIHAVPK